MTLKWALSASSKKQRPVVRRKPRTARAPWWRWLVVPAVVGGVIALKEAVMIGQGLMPVMGRVLLTVIENIILRALA